MGAQHEHCTPWSWTKSLGVMVTGAIGLGQWSQVVLNRTPLANSNTNSLLTQSLRIFVEPPTGW